MPKLVLISDTHGYLPTLPACDIVLHAGDFSPKFDHDLTFQRSWYSTNFLSWINDLPCKHFVHVSGNHDFQYYSKHSHLHREIVGYSGMQACSSKRIYLENSKVTLDGLTIIGFPWQLPFGNGWAFNAYEDELEKIYSKIPEGIDIIISHGPPYSYGDLAPRERYPDGRIKNWENAGSKALLSAIDRVKPKLVVCGHLHSGYGIYQRNNTTIINAAACNEQHIFANTHIEWEL